MLRGRGGRNKQGRDLALCWNGAALGPPTGSPCQAQAPLMGPESGFLVLPVGSPDEKNREGPGWVEFCSPAGWGLRFHCGRDIVLSPQTGSLEFWLLNRYLSVLAAYLMEQNFHVL